MDYRYLYIHNLHLRLTHMHKRRCTALTVETSWAMLQTENCREADCDTTCMQEPHLCSEVCLQSLHLCNSLLCSIPARTAVAEVLCACWQTEAFAMRMLCSPRVQ